jgi:hypothetical protein
VIDRVLLAESLTRLDAGTRALLDLSLRRAIPDDQVAKVLGVDPASIPPRRARGIAQLADMMGIPGPSELAALLIAIPDLPDGAWGVPTPEPFSGGVSRARRAKAFRRVAVAASPLVALGAVMAAVLVSADHSGGGPGSIRAQRASGAAGAGAGAGAAVSAAAPEARHGLPAGVVLTLAHPASRPGRHARHAARHHRSRHHGHGEAEPAILTHLSANGHAESVALHRAPVVRHTPHQPAHQHHHHAPTKHKVTHTPKHTPSPAPVETPSVPVSTPAPAQTEDSGVQLSAPDTHTGHGGPSPGKPGKSPVPQPDLRQPGDDGDDGDGGGSCDDRHGRGVAGGDSSSHQGSPPGQSRQHGQGRGGHGKSWSPPGLFRKRHGHG